MSTLQTTLDLGGTTQMVALAVFDDGSTLSVTSLGSWQSDNPGVASVDGDGLVEANQVGDARIRCEYDGVLSAAFTITVQPPALVALNLAVSPWYQEVGEPCQGTLIGTYSDGSTQDLSTQATWVISEPTVLDLETANPLVFRALMPGLCNVYATFMGIDSAAIDFQVTPATLPGQPYPPSTEILDMSIDWTSHVELAPGSDNWPVTWSGNGQQYCSWGDGGGFGGTNSDGRVSLGVARLEGDAATMQGFNVFGGFMPENPATFEGKSYGILAIGTVLYMWVGPGSGVDNYTESRLYTSDDNGATWQAASWAFQQSQGVVLPTFLQFGPGYTDRRDNFVYIYGIELQNAASLQVQTPGGISLMRVPIAGIDDLAQYEYFAGLTLGLAPTWTPVLGSRVPVFADTNGVGWNVSVTYNDGLGRYLLCTEHTASFQGRLGVFEAPEPWGPWNVVRYDDSFGFGTTGDTAFFWNFSNKWTSVDGLNTQLLFTGTLSNDSYNMVSATFVVP